MARFFQAPVIKREDYAFQYPNKEIMEALKVEQSLQDQNLAAAMKLYDVGQQDVVQHTNDKALRDKLIQDRYNQVDNIIYDESGNMADLRGIGNQIQSISRGWAKQTQTGGGIHSLATNLATQKANDERIEKLYEAGKITLEHRDWSKNMHRQLYAMQGGIGDPNSGTYNSYTTFDAAPTKDATKIALDYAAGWQSDKIQKGDIDPITGLFVPNAEFISKMEAEYPDYISTYTVDGKGNPKGTGHFQTGALEYITSEEIYRNTALGLAEDAELMSYLSQEAQFLGGATTQEEVEKYIEESIHNASLIASEKYSKMHFDTKVVENWKLKLDYKQKLNQALIDYASPKPDPVKVIESTSPNLVYELDPKELANQYDTATKNLADLDNAMNKLLNGKTYDQLDPEDKATYDTYINQRSNLAAQIAGYENSIKHVDDKLKDEGKDLYFETVRSVANNFWGSIGMLVDVEDLSNEANKKLVEGLYTYLNNNFDKKELSESLSKGTIPGLNNTLNEIFKEYPEIMQEFKRTANKTGQNLLNDQVDYTNILSKYKNNIATTEVFTVEDNVGKWTTHSATENNEIKLLQDDILYQMIENGVEDAFTIMGGAGQGSGFTDIYSYAQQHLPSGTEIQKGSLEIKQGEMSDRGNGYLSVSFKTNKGKQYTVFLEEKRGVETNLDERRINNAISMITSAKGIESTDLRNYTMALGFRQFAQVKFGKQMADAGLFNLERLPKGKGGSIIIRQGTVPKYQITKLKNGGGYLLSEAHSTGAMDTANTLLANMGKKDGSDRLVYDTREYGNHGAHIYEDINALLEELGNAHWKESYNAESAYYKTQKTVPAPSPQINFH